MKHLDWWESPYLWFALAAASVLPVAVVLIPPLTDLPNHIARYLLLLTLASSPDLQQDYAVNWRLTGNLGVDLVVCLIGPWLGAEGGARVGVAMIPALTLAGIYALSRSLNGRVSPAALVAAPLAFNYPLNWGLVNFSLSAAIALLVLALWIRLRSLGFAARFLLFAPLGFLTWIAHLAGWGLLGLGAFGFELARARKAQGLRVGGVMNAALQTLPFVATFAATAVWSFQNQASLHVVYEGKFVRAKLIQLASLFREHNLALDMVATAIYLVLLLAFYRACGRRLVPAAVAIFALYITAFFVVPQWIFQSGFIDRRILPYAFIVLPLCIAVRGAGATNGDQRKLISGLAAAALLFFLLRLSLTTFFWASTAAAWEKRLEILHDVPPNSRIFSLVVARCGGDWSRLGRPAHLPMMALVRHGSVVNGLFQGEGFNPVEVLFKKQEGFDPNMRTAVNDVNCPKTGHGEGSVQWAISKFPRSSFGYLWLMAEDRLPPIDETGLDLVAALGNDRIYRVRGSHPPR